MAYFRALLAQAFPIKPVVLAQTVVVALVSGVSANASAGEFTVLGGLQLNDDVEASAAQEQSVGSFAAPTGSGSSKIAVDDGEVFGFALDFPYRGDATKRVGAYVSRHSAEFDDQSRLLDTELIFTHVHFTAMSYYPREKLEPFVMAGVGLTHFEPQDSTLRSDNKFSLQVGAGSNYRLTNSVLLRADIRWIPTFVGNEGGTLCKNGRCTVKIESEFYHQVQLNIGVMFRF